MSFEPVLHVLQHGLRLLLGDCTIERLKDASPVVCRDVGLVVRGNGGLPVLSVTACNVNLGFLAVHDCLLVAHSMSFSVWLARTLSPVTKSQQLLRA